MLRSKRVLHPAGLALLVAGCGSPPASQPSDDDANGAQSTSATAGPASPQREAATRTPTQANTPAGARAPSSVEAAPAVSAGASAAAPRQPMQPPAAGITGSGSPSVPAAAGAASPTSTQAAAGAPGVAAAPAGACASMVAAAQALISSLDSEALRSAAVQPFSKHHNFAYEPEVADRPGLSFMMMSEPQRQKALALVRSGLSEEGFKKAETVRALENLKAVTGFQVTTRDPTHYWLAIFGEPSETGEWGWQWEGHHLALHYTFKACAISDTPVFMGAWPAEVSTMAAGGPALGTRNLEQEEELGRALAKSLSSDPAKWMQTLKNAAYRQMLPEGPDKATPMTPTGLAASAMSDSEQMQLRKLVSFYANLMQPELAAARLARIEAHGGFQKVSFVWTGSLEPKQRHFYRVQGESFFIEYRNDDGNHIHSAWRDFSGDFGDDLR